MRRVVLASLLLIVLVSPLVTVLADQNVQELNKAEKNIDNAQQRVENVKQRMMGSSSSGESDDIGGSGISDRLSSVLESAKDKLGILKDDSIQEMGEKARDSLSNIGEESLSEKTARRIREALGRDTLTDKAQHLYNDAKQGLSDVSGDIQDRVSNLGEETLTEKAARKVRQALGKETMADKAQKQYNEAKEYLKQAKDTDFSEYPEKAQYLKDRLSALGQQAMNSASEKLDDLNDVIEPSLWEKVKLKLGLKHEPTNTEKAQYIAQHLKEQASDKANELKDAAIDTLGVPRDSHISESFNRFLSKIGSSPVHAVNTAKEWIGLDPATRERRRREKAMSKEAHEALDELIERLMDQVDNDPSKVESIKITVKTEEKPAPSFVEEIKEKLLGSSSDEEGDSDIVDPSEGYVGMKHKIHDMVQNAKEKLQSKGKVEEESYADMAQRKLREATSAGKESLSESFTEKASRKVREALGRDTVSDKVHHKMDDMKDIDTSSIKDRIGDMVDSAKDKLHMKSGESSTEFASRKYEDAKESLSSLGHETLAERAARKVREALGRETLADKAHRQMEEAREMYLNALDNMPSIDDAKARLAAFGSESLTEKAARKVREALGQDTLADKAHRKLADAREILDSLNAATAKEKLNEAKESVSNIDIDSIKEKVSDTYDAMKEKIPSSSDIKDSISSIGSESLGEKTARKVREALGRDTVSDKVHHKMADIKDTLSASSDSVSDKLSSAKDSLDKLSSIGEETLSERAARKVREALGRDTLVDKAHARVEEAREYLKSLNAEALKNKAGEIKESVAEKASDLKESIASKLPGGGEEPVQKGKFQKMKEAVFGNPKDNKIEAAQKQLEDALRKLEQAKTM